MKVLTHFFNFSWNSLVHNGLMKYPQIFNLTRKI